jgi:chaperonin GroEL
MGKRIEFDAAAREALRRGVDQLAAVVRVTLGPRGRNVVIDRGHGAPTITNDGLTIASEIELSDPFENMGVQLVREVALKTGEVAGDGTTTATVLTHSLVTDGLRAIGAGHNPMAVKRGIERAVAAVVEDLRRQSRRVERREDISRIATVSARNDPEFGALVADAMERVGRHGVITVEEGRGMETTLEVAEGVRFERGYLSPYFVTSPDTMEVVLDQALILLTDLKFSTARELVPALELAAHAGRPLLVVADDVESEALATLVVNRLRGTLSSVAVRAPESGGRRRELLEDIAVLTGARLFARDLGRSLEHLEAADFGRAGRVVVDKDSTTIVRGGGRAEALRERIAMVEHALAASESSHERDALSERLGRLTGGVAVVRVGAPVESALAERRTRIEDALAAIRAAVEEGVVAGGGVALLRAQPVVVALTLAGDEQVGRDIVLAALEAPARQIADNAGEPGRVSVERIREHSGAWGYNALTGQYEDLEAAGIIDPAKVTRCALQHAASIGSMVLTTDAIVVNTPEEEGNAGGGEAGGGK